MPGFTSGETPDATGQAIPKLLRSCCSLLSYLHLPHESFQSYGIPSGGHVFFKYAGGDLANEGAALDGGAGQGTVGGFREDVAHAGAMGGAGETHSGIHFARGAPDAIAGTVSAEIDHLGETGTPRIYGRERGI